VPPAIAAVFDALVDAPDDELGGGDERAIESVDLE